MQRVPSAGRPPATRRAARIGTAVSCGRVSRCPPGERRSRGRSRASLSYTAGQALQSTWPLPTMVAPQPLQKRASRLLRVLQAAQRRVGAGRDAGCAGRLRDRQFRCSGALVAAASSLSSGSSSSAASVTGASDSGSGAFFLELPFDRLLVELGFGESLLREAARHARGLAQGSGRASATAPSPRCESGTSGWCSPLRLSFRRRARTRGPSGRVAPRAFCSSSALGAPRPSASSSVTGLSPVSAGGCSRAA